MPAGLIKGAAGINNYVGFEEIEKQFEKEELLYHLRGQEAKR
jgi:hypothetical protein